MPSIFSNLFSKCDLEYFTENKDVLDAKVKLDSTNVVYFDLPLTETIRESLATNLGLDLSKTPNVPMRWIKGDTPAHTDVGSTNFENTYLVYLNDSAGEFVIDDTSYSINANSAFVFSEGINHFTQNTGSCPRLLLGPMNEFGQSVGRAPAIFYFNNYSDALNFNTSDSTVQPIAQSNFGNIVLGENIDSGSIGNITSWRVASGGDPSPTGVYNNGFDLSIFGLVDYSVYPSAPCFLEGTKILTIESCTSGERYVPIETLKKGDLVKTIHSGYRQIEMIGKSTIDNPGNSERIENRLYKCSPENYPELTEDLYITGCHSILVDEITEVERENLIKSMGKIYVTDKKYRLIASVDERAEPWNSEGTYTIWHLALQNDDERMNYGIYANGGLLVETCSLNYFKKWANLV
jgi:hypothetical protein